MSANERTAALLAAIVAWSDDAIVSKDLNGYVTSWNGAAERMFGFTETEMIGQSITRIIPAERLSEEDFVLSQVRSGITVDHFETVRQRKDGSLLDVSLTVSPVRTSAGEIIGASKIARDITEQKRLRRAVEDASRAKDEFLATLSHELRTPLNPVIGYMHMLQQGKLPPAELAKALETVIRNADLLTRLVNDVLDTSRIVTGRMRVTPRACDLGAILEQSLSAITPAARAKSIELKSTIAPNLKLHGDPDRLLQVMWNLLSNAVKFTPSRGSVTLTATRMDEVIRVSVEDTGIGMTPESLPNVFRRFWQADATHSRLQPGLGLGLALARDLVELHGGSLEVHSAGLGFGARFDVVLPTPG